MMVPPLIRISELATGLAGRLSRRRFLKGIPLVAAAAATACTGEAEQEARPPRDTGEINSDSRLDTALVQPGGHGSHSITPSVEAAAEIPYRRYDPTLPPLSDERTLRVHWRSQEVPVRISPNMVVAAWTFEYDVPGPILHVRQGDTIEFTLTNEGDVPHSMDFHAAQVNPEVAFRSVAKGQSVTFTFQPRYAGAFMYHCATAPVLMHIGTGMYGAIIVDPPESLPPAREFVLVQGEYYIADARDGIIPFDYQKMATAIPDYVVFNGRPDQYVREPIRVNVGDRVRFYVVAAGPTYGCSFHVVGEQFDEVYLGAPPHNPLVGVQTFEVPAGGGMVFDLIADIPGKFPFVNHAFGHGQKGAIGFLEVME